MPGFTRFQLMVPLKVEEMLEGLLGQTPGASFNGRNHKAGDLVADLIRAEVARRPAPKKPKVAADSDNCRNPKERAVVRGVVKTALSKAAANRKPPEPD